MSASVGSVIANLVKTCIGAGMLSLPNTVYLAGVYPAIIILIVVAAYITYCTKLITDSMSALNSKPREDQDPFALLTYMAFGKSGVAILQIAMIVTVYGIATAYEITWSTMLSGLGWDAKVLNTMWPWALVYLVLALPLSLLRKMEGLAIPSLLGNIVVVTICVIVVVFGFYKVDHSGMSMVVHGMWTSPLDLAKFFGNICYSLCVPVIGATCYNTMRRPEKFNVALTAAVTLCAVVYLSIGVFGSITYGTVSRGNIAPIVIADIDVKWLYVVCCVGICFVAYFSFPVAVYPGVIALESMLKDKPDAPEENGTFVKDRRRQLIRLGMTVVVTIVSLSIPDFKKVISIIGCLTLTYISFILPPLLHFVLIPQSKPRQWLDIGCAILGVCILVISTIASIV